MMKGKWRGRRFGRTSPPIRHRRRMKCWNMRIGCGGRISTERFNDMKMERGFSTGEAAGCRLLPPFVAFCRLLRRGETGKGKRDANLASQARHEMGAQWSCSLTRNVVANERE